MSYTLLGSALIALCLGEILDTLAILAILLLNSVISYLQSGKANLALKALQKIYIPKSRVIREGKTFMVLPEDVVPGDLLQFEAGDYVPADARIIEAFGLTVDESSLTGESLPVKKHTDIINSESLIAERNNMVHSGSLVCTGTGRAIVTMTGMETEIGKIAVVLEETTYEKTPLQKRIDILVRRLILIGIGLIIAVILVHYMYKDPMYPALMLAISLAVAAIPEGLPTVVTLALLVAVRRMIKQNAIVHNIGDVETLGSATIICTDKTGTLTEGRISVSSVYRIGEEEKLLKAIVMCNNASIEGEGIGDPTEIALLKYAQEKGLDIDKARSKVRKIHEWSFDSYRKCMSVLIKEDDENSLFVKGAPEVLIELCRLSDSQRGQIELELHQRSSRGDRLLLVASKQGHFSGEARDVEQDLTFHGLISLSDPLRSDTIPAIAECQQSGIKIIMITGDHPATALAIATDLGIVTPGSSESVLSGEELEKMDRDQLRQKVDQICVYARVSPGHKMMIVTALQDKGHIVAMTGDGVNDALALKKAQIGIAMGRNGSEVARQAARMILMDDNFSTIVSAIREGRAIFGNIKRTIQYLLSTNLSEVIIVLGSSLIGVPAPFFPTAILWINLVTDGLPALALSTEPVDREILKLNPSPSPASFFDRAFIFEMIFTALLMSIIFFSFYFYSLESFGSNKSKSLAFHLMILMSLLRSVTCRSDKKTFYELGANHRLVISIVIPIFGQYCLQHTQWYSNIFKVETILFLDYGKLILIATIVPAFLEINKVWKRKK